MQSRLTQRLGRVDAVDESAIVGTLDIPPHSDPIRVALFVNNVEVDRVDVPPSGQGPSTFRFPIKDMWRFCGPDDRVTVRVGAGFLRMPDGKWHFSPAEPRNEPLARLAKRLRAGELINSQGVLAPPKYLDAEWQQTATELHQQVHEAVRDIVGYESFLIYGSLLGAVREGRPLGHDYDFDTAYLSSHTDPAMVTAEAGRLALALQDRGFAVEARMTCIHVSDASRKLRIDLYHLYFNDADELRLAWGTASDIPFTRQQWSGTEEIQFGGAKVLIPRNAEELVETLYGSNWRTPNPGFDWETARKDRAREAFFPAQLRPIVNWQDYWQRVAFDSSTSFARFISKTPMSFGFVVDLGCGDGRDVPKFVRAGVRVMGLDRAPSAIESAQRRRLEVDFAEFAVCDFSQPDALRAALARIVDGRPRTLYYGRHLLDSIPDSVQTSLLAELGELMRPGDSVALEFRGLQDETLTPHELRSCGRRVVDPDSVRGGLISAGLDIDVDDEGTQWEGRGVKRMYLHRIVARKPA